MEEVCEAGLKTLQTNFWVEELFSARNVLVISGCRKRLVMSTPKKNNLMQLF